MNIKRGDIYLASLDPVIGNEISKTRPVIVVSNDINNEYSSTVTILPVTSANLDKIYPFEVILLKGEGNLSKNSKVKANQIRTIDKTRLIKFLGEIQDMTEIDNSIKIHLSLN